MAEVRGYPNPNYTDEDIREGVTLEEIGLVTVNTDHYEELVSKAAMFDCMASSVKLTGKVDDMLVKAVTGNLLKEELVPKKEADDYWRYYTREQAKAKELSEKVSSLERANKDLVEILKQNNIGEWADKEEKNDEKADDHREPDC